MEIKTICENFGGLKHSDALHFYLFHCGMCENWRGLVGAYELRARGLVVVLPCRVLICTQGRCDLAADCDPQCNPHHMVYDSWDAIVRTLAQVAGPLFDHLPIAPDILVVGMPFDLRDCYVKAGMEVENSVER